MKTSNKLLLGLFALIIVAITIGLVILKVELKNSGLNVSEVNKNRVNETISMVNAEIAYSDKTIIVIFI